MMRSTMSLGAAVLFVLGCSRQPADMPRSAAPSSTHNASAAKPAFPGFTVNISFTEKAKRTLIARKETVIVVGYLSGNPKPGAAKTYVDEMGQVNLGEIHAEVAAGESANFGEVKFGEIKLKQYAFLQTDQKNTQIDINVYTGRKSSENNLIECGIYDGPLEPIQGTRVPIACKLISELNP